MLEGGYHLERSVDQVSRKGGRRPSKGSVTNEGTGKEECGGVGALISSCVAHIEALAL